MNTINSKSGKGITHYIGNAARKSFSNMPNFVQASPVSFLKSLALYGGLIYLAIETTVLIRPIDPVVVYTDKFVKSPTTTDQRGLYINDFRVPVELFSGTNVALPYDLVKNPNNSIRILVDDASLEVELYSKSGSSWNLESKIEPTAKDKEGKDGLTLNGRIRDEYKLVVKAPGKTYQIIIN